MITEADDFSLRALQSLRNLYRLVPDAPQTYRKGLRVLEEAEALTGVEEAPAVAALESFLADVLLASGLDISTVRTAKGHADSALRRLPTVIPSSGRIRSVAVHTALLSSIASKALGDHDEAHRVLETTQEHLRRRLGIQWIDAIPLVRQQVLMSQKREDFLQLANAAGTYRQSRPTEYYASLKRFFEYLLNHGRLDMARQVLTPLQSAYYRAAGELPIVARISFLKNAGHYMLLERSPRKGVSLLTQALTASVHFNLHGQARQIARLITESREGSPTLAVFRV